MGDRASVKITQEGGRKPALYIYTHWNGSELPGIIKNALLRGRPRWSDEPYLARIIFSEFIGGDWSGLTGYGLTTYLTDSSYSLLVVDVENREVHLQTLVGDEMEEMEIIKTWTFEEYIALPSHDWEYLESTVAVGDPKGSMPDLDDKTDANYNQDPRLATAAVWTCPDIDNLRG